MSIKRDEIDNRKVDFSDIGSGRRLAARAPWRNPSRRVLDADEDQRLRTCQCDQSTPQPRQ